MRSRLLIAIVTVSVTALPWLSGPPAQEAKPVVYVLPVDGVIDMGLAPFVSRGLDEAERAGAAAVILEVNTFGGRVDAAVLIRDALLRATVPTVAFVNNRAISAGALITLAAGKIAMARGSTIGAATPVKVGAPGAPAQPVAEKTVSYLRKEFRATAESRDRPGRLAEAMVDADVEIEGLIAKGKLLTLTAREASAQGLVDIQADTLEQVLAALNLARAEVRRMSATWAEEVVRFLTTWAEEVVRFLTHPVVSSLLMTIGVLGLIVELRMPGFGLPGILGITSLALFFWGHWLVRLAGWEELLLLAVGLFLLALEVFVIPGFGVAGFLGLLALMGGLGLSLVGSGATWPVVMEAVGRTALSLVLAILAALVALRYLAILAALVALRYLARSPFGQQFVLKEELAAGEGYASAPEADRRWLGKRGTVVSALRPSGIAQIEGQRVDVVSEGGYIEAGDPVEVTRVDGNRIVVRKAAAPLERSEP